MKHYLNRLFDEVCLWIMGLLIVSTPIILGIGVVKIIQALAGLQ